MTAPAGASPTPLQLQHAPKAKTLNALLHMPDAPMEMSQIGLIYRAEGNANLVLALPQFKKVLRLPKMISSRQQKQQREQQPAAGAGQPEGQPSISDPTTKASSAKAGVLTMPDFMAYIEIMRRLLGNEFVCAADIVAIPKECDRFWINEHIRVHRPVARLDKEFVGPFGLLLPDVTQLPATFDVLLANLQAKDMNMDADADMEDISNSRITRLGDTYAIEIKPKQGWLQLPSDVSDLFDLMPAGVGTKDNTATTTTTATELTYDPASKVRPMGQALLLAPNRCWCRYCCMQHVKLHTGKIKRLGDYCPMQLFSGTPCRMLDALNALFACPQNNLRVFQSGNLIYGDHANSISCEELHSRVFPGEIMVLIKHLLVACLLREYSSSSKELAKEVKSQSQSQRRRRSESHSHVANVAFGESPCEPFAGLETKETTEIGVANVDVAAAAWHVEKLKQVQEEADDTGIVEFVKAVDGQPQRRRNTRAADAEKAKRTKIATSTTTATTSSMSTNVAIAAARTEATTETETMATATATAMASSSSSSTQAQINNAEIFHLPNNCVLQKILHLQLLAKRHFHYMWQHGYAQHETPTYQALRALLNSSSQTLNVEELPPEQAYMLGATALDCSIMLTFQEIRSPDKHNSSLQPWLVCVKDHQFLTKLSILDLDPKPDSHYHKFIKHSREIEKCCRALN